MTTKAERAAMDYGELLAAAEPLLTLPALHTRYNKFHDAAGKFSSGGGPGGPGGGPADGGGGNPFDDPHAEWNLDESGQPRFSPSYTARYGRVIHETGCGPNSDVAVAVTEKRGFHVADDSAGTLRRQVVQDLTPASARSLAGDLDKVTTREATSVTNGATGARLTARGPATKASPKDFAPIGAVQISWSGGQVMDLDSATAFDLVGALDSEAATYEAEFGRRSRMDAPTSGWTTEAISSTAQLRAKAGQFLAPPNLPGDEPAVSVAAGIADADLPARAKEFLPQPPPVEVEAAPVEVITAGSLLRAGAAEYLAPPEPPDPEAEVTAAITAGARLYAEAEDVMAEFPPQDGPEPPSDPDEDETQDEPTAGAPAPVEE